MKKIEKKTCICSISCIIFRQNSANKRFRHFFVENPDTGRIKSFCNSAQNCCLDKKCLDKCLESVLNVPRNLPVKFHQNRVSNSWDIPDMGKCPQDKCCLDNCQLDSWTCSRYSKDATFKVSLKLSQYQLRYSWYGQMSPGQMLAGQMSPWQLESVLDVPRNLPLKFNQNEINNSWDILDIDKCHLFKCCPDKCHRDIWNMSYMFPGTCL